MSRIKEAMVGFWKAQQGRRFLWLPVLVALGIAIYFALPSEPDWRALVVSSVIVALLAAWKRSRFRLPWAMLLLPLIGMSWAAYYTSLQHPVLLTHEITPRTVSGTVRDIERVEHGIRLTLEQVGIRGLPPEETPHRVRLSLRLKPDNKLPLPHIGDEISLMAGLLPPMGAALPGGFDFARYFYFRDIGAVGYGLPPWTITKPIAQTGFMQWRQVLTGQIIDTLGPERGPIAAGLITGEGRAIREVDFEALRASNLYHIIAISGGHMVVIAGVIFIGLRLLFLLLPGAFGLRPQAKSLAAMVTLAVVTVYLFVTGLPISAVRAYVMIALVLAAVILRRDADAMRSLMLTLLIMLMCDPSDLLEPGFQLSFVATLAIVALAESLWFRPASAESGLVARAWRALLGMVLISLVAEAATSLLVARMFNTFAPYGVLANAAATPLVAVVLMPAVALFFLLLPFGAEHVALALLDPGIRALMWIATTISQWPHAQLFVSSPPLWGAALGLAGLLFLCLVQQRIRWIGALMLLIGWASILTVKQPDLLVGAQAKQIALRTPSGVMLVRGRPDSLVPQLWANGLGTRELPVLKPGTSSWRCDRVGCMALVGGQHFAFPHHASAFAEDCQRADWVISILRTRGCKAQMISSYALAREGAQAFWLEESGVRHESGADWQGHRPWSMRQRD